MSPSIDIQEWVHSLSKEELQSAMTFAFPMAAASQHKNRNHEFHLLQQMIQKQIPLPIPIFNRAIPIHPASTHGVTHVQQYEDILYCNLQCRLRKPRLFQWIRMPFQTEYERTPTVPSSSFSYRRKYVLRHGYNSNHKICNRQSHVAVEEEEPMFDILTRQGIAPWGDLWNVGCTEQQRHADELLLVRTCIQYQGGMSSNSNSTILPSFLLDSNLKSSSSYAICFFHPTPSMSSKDILNILYIVSRGHFLRNRTTTTTTMEDIPYCASWFHPTQEWFSLSKYIASRFEVSIRQYYKFCQKQNREISLIHHNDNNIYPQIFHTDIPWNNTILDTAYLKATSQLLQNDYLFISSGYYRDMNIWKLLTTSSYHHHQQHDNNTLSSLHFLSFIPFIYFGSPLDTLRLHILSCLQNEVSQLSEKSLIQSLNEEDEKLIFSNKKNKSMDVKMTTKKKKKNIKKKKKTRNHKQEEEMTDIHSSSALNHQDIDDDDDDEGQVDDDDESKLVPLKNVSEPLSLEKSRNTIMVMSLLEDIIDFVVSEKEVIDSCSDVQEEGLKDETQNMGVIQCMENRSSNERLESHTSFISTEESPSPSSTEGNKIITTAFIDIQSLPIVSPEPTMTEMSTTFVQVETKDIVVDPRMEMKMDERNSVQVTTTTNGSQAHQPLTRQWLSFHDLMVHHSPPDPPSTMINTIKTTDDGAFYIIDDIALVTDMWWNRRPYPTRDKSIFADFFPDDTDHDADDLVASSTVASLASSILDDTGGDYRLSSIPPDGTASKEDLRVPATLHRETLLPVLRVRGTNIVGPLNHQRARSVSSHDALDMIKSSQPCMVPALRKRGATFMNPFNIEKARSVSSHDALDMNRSTRSFDHKRMLDTFRTSTTSTGAGNNNPLGHHQLLMKEVIIDAGNVHLNFCAQSEAAINVLEESSHLNVIPKPSAQDEGYQIAAYRDENSTISSAPSESPGEVITIRDERNSYRDLCLKLAAENAKMRNLLALINQSYPNANSGEGTVLPFVNLSHHEHIRPYRFDGAMSDVCGLMSEDGTIIHESSTANSMDYITCSGTHVTLQPSSHQGPMRHVHLNGLESRLTTEINIFLDNIATQLKSLAPRRAIASTRLKRLVTLLWPRAQVKIYGSHLSNLSLPSSDMDFVICLPAIHVNANVDAAGVLEGQHSTNEPHQKVLARKLRHESWIGKTIF